MLKVSSEILNAVLALAVAVLLLLGALHPAKAYTDEQGAYAAAGIITYNKTCSPLSDDIVNLGNRLRYSVPDELYSKAAMHMFELFLKYVRDTGSKDAAIAAFCAKLKSIIDNG